MKLSKELVNRQGNTYFFNSHERAFFYRFNHVIPTAPCFEAYRLASKPFDIIRANIVIRAFLNKRDIESHIYKNYMSVRARLKKRKPTALSSELKEITKRFPYVEKDGVKCMIPFFPSHLNELYSDKPELLLKKPYSRLRKNYVFASVDPFDYYGPAIYESLFCRLYKVAEGKNVTAFLDYDSLCVYFIDEQGRLENQLALFDKDMPQPDKTNLIARVGPVCEAYFEGDKTAVLRALVDNKLLSAKASQEICDADAEETYDEPNG